MCVCLCGFVFGLSVHLSVSLSICLFVCVSVSVSVSVLLFLSVSTRVWLSQRLCLTKFVSFPVSTGLRVCVSVGPNVCVWVCGCVGVIQNPRFCMIAPTRSVTSTQPLLMHSSIVFRMAARAKRVCTGWWRHLRCLVFSLSSSCSVLQCVAVCCSVLRCVAVCRETLKMPTLVGHCVCNVYVQPLIDLRVAHWHTFSLAGHCVSNVYV